MLAKLEIDLGNELDDYLQILNKKIKYKKGLTTIKKERGRLAIKIEAEDLLGLAVSIRSIVKQLHLIGKVRSLSSTSTNSDNIINMKSK